MSLINQMLRNLDARRQLSGGVIDDSVVVTQMPQSNKGPLVWAVLLVITGLTAAFLFDRFYSREAAPTTVATAASTVSLANVSQVLPIQQESAENSADPMQIVEQKTSIPAQAPVVARPSLDETRGLSSQSGSSKTVSEVSAGAVFILQQPSDYHAVQIIALQDEKKILAYASAAGLADPLYAQLRSANQSFYILLLGIYPDELSAFNARDQWVAMSRGSSETWVRPLGPLQEAIATANTDYAFNDIVLKDNVFKDNAYSRPAREMGNNESQDRQSSSFQSVRTGGITEQGMLSEVAGLVQGNGEYEARDMLEQYLVSDPGSVATVVALFKLYLQLDDPEMAEQLLRSSGLLPPLTIRELKVQLMVHRGDLAGAIARLEATASDNKGTTGQALLAGLYQQVGRFSEAARLYRQLLNTDPAQGVYWLGLAVALDSSDQSADALRAFKRTRASGAYDGDVRRYVERRIRALSR